MAGKVGSHTHFRPWLPGTRDPSHVSLSSLLLNVEISEESNSSSQDLGKRRVRLKLAAAKLMLSRFYLRKVSASKHCTNFVGSYLSMHVNRRSKKQTTFANRQAQSQFSSPRDHDTMGSPGAQRGQQNQADRPIGGRGRGFHHLELKEVCCAAAGDVEMEWGSARA